MSDTQDDHKDYDVVSPISETTDARKEMIEIEQEDKYVKGLDPEQRKEYFDTKEKLAKGIPLESEPQDAQLQDVYQKARKDCYDKK